MSEENKLTNKLTTCFHVSRQGRVCVGHNCFIAAERLLALLAERGLDPVLEEAPHGCGRIRITVDGPVLLEPEGLCPEESCHE